MWLMLSSHFQGMGVERNCTDAAVGSHPKVLLNMEKSQKMHIEKNQLVDQGENEKGTAVDDQKVLLEVFKIAFLSKGQKKTVPR